MNTSAKWDDFSDMDDLDSAPTLPESRAKQAQRAAAPMIDCPHCRGTGRVTWGYVNIQSGECRQCKGTGKVRADWEKRRAAFRKGEETKAANKKARAEAWRTEHPAEAEWLRKAGLRGFNFAVSMEDAVAQYGSLTEKQLAAVRSCMAKDAERNAARESDAKAREVAVAGTNGIIEALTKATRGGHKAPKLRTRVANFSLAKPHSANAGCVYVVTADDLYLGKITPDGVFKPSRDCSDEQKAGVAEVAADALNAAIEYGKQVGRCSCCGRELTDPESIAKGIGPICEAGFF